VAFDPNKPFDLLTPPRPAGFDPSQPFEVVGAEREPGRLRRAAAKVKEVAGNLVMSEAEYQRRLESGEEQSSGLGRRVAQAAAGVVQGSPGMVGEALNSPEFNETVYPTVARMGPAVMAAAATTPQGATALGLANLFTAGVVGDLAAQNMENRAGVREGYSAREAAGGGAASTVLAARLPANATLGRSVVQGAVEGATMMGTSAVVGGRELSGEELLVAAFLGGGFRGVTNAAAREQLRKQLLEQAEALGYQGKGSMRDMREWYRSEVAKRAEAPAAPDPVAAPRQIGGPAEPAPAAAPAPRPVTPSSPSPAPVAPVAPMAAAPAPVAPVAPVVARPATPAVGDPPAVTQEGFLRDARTGQVVTEEGDWLSETGIPFRLEKKYPIGEVVVNRDVPQFKGAADATTGVVEKLGGKAYVREGTAPIVLWEKLNGETEVVTGRHRLAKGREVGEKDLPAYVFREKDGFTRDNALIFDAESNIRDGQGEVKDYAYYYRTANIDQATAGERGLLRGSKANSGWHLGKDASDDLWTLYANDQITEGKAVAIARGAPAYPAAQASAMRLAKSKSAAELELYARNLSRLAPADGVASEQLGFAGIAEDFAAFEAEAAKVAAVQADKIQANQDLITAAKGAARKPEAARKMGLPVDDPDALKARVADLETQVEQLRNPNAETFELLRREAGLPPREVAPPEAPAAPAVVDAEGQMGLLGEDAMGFNLAGEVQAAPAGPVVAPVDNTPSMFAPAEVVSTAPTKLDQANAAARAEMQPGARAVAQRAVNAEERFIEFAQEQAGLTRDEALTALAAYRQAKAITIDPVGGEFRFTDGRFAEAEVLRRAAKRSTGGGTSGAAELAVVPGQAAAPGRPRVRRDRQAEREASLPPYRPDAPLLWQGSKGAYVQVPLARLDGIPIVQMPELVRLVKQLTGEVPDIKKLRRALGMFRHQDVLGVSKIQLDPRIFKDTPTATKVLAHEIGHFIDWLPHHSLERGNILGHMASLRTWALSTLPDRPRNPNSALTTKERAKLYRDAEKQTRAELGKRPPADGDDADPHAHAAWGERRSEIYREKIEAEIKTRKLVRADEVRAELIALTDHWKPYLDLANKGELPEGYIRYRESSKELYADALSVLFNSPATLKEIAPLFYDGFFAYLRNKPEVFKALLQTWELVGGRQKAILDLRDAELRAAAKSGEEIWRRKAAEREARSKTGWKGWVDGMRAEVEDIYYPLLKREAEARGAGKPVPLSKSPTVLFEEFAMADNAPYRYLQKLHETVMAPLQAAGLTWEDYHLYLFYNRVLNERFPATPEGLGGGRSQVANPGGISPEAARLGLLNWRLNHGIDKYQNMLRADAAMRRLTDEITRDAVRSGVYSAKTYEEVIKPNLDNYAAFAVLDYLSESVPASIQVGQGTFKEIANTATATTLKMLSLRRWIQRNDTVRFTTGWMREFAPDEIQPAKTKWDGKRHVPVDPPRDSGLVLLEEFVDGAKVGHYVPKDVARMFEDMSPGKMAAVIKPFNWFFREGVYPMWITFNPYFQLFSGPARDLRRNLRNMPGVSGKAVAAEFAANYATLLGETGAATVRVLGRIPGLGALRNYRPDVPMTKAAEAVRAHLRGESNPIINEMMAVGALGTPYDNFRSGLFNQDDAIQRAMERVNLLPPSKEKASLTRALRKVLYGVEHAGLSFEMMAKVAPYTVLRDRGATPREAAHFVRNYVGVPNFRKRGRYTREVGSMLPFFNVFLRGYSSDLELALKGPGKTGTARPAGAGSRTGWWLRYFSGSGMWAVIKGMAKVGLLGTVAKELWDRIGDFDNTNFTTIPLGSVEGGEIDGKKTMYLRLPEDETDRLLSAFIYKTILRLGGVQTDGRNLAAFGAEQLPSVNPLITLAEGWGAWASGYNPRDGLRGSPILTNDVWLEGGWPALRDMTLWTAQETGAANFFRYDPRANTTLEVSLNSVPGLGRVIKVSDAGLLQAQAEGELDERRDGAVFRNSLPEDVARLRRSYYWLQRLGREGRSLDQENRYMELMIWKRSVYDPMEASVLDFGRQRLTREEARWLRERSAPFRDFRD
jgi:hypothetical protein